MRPLRTFIALLSCLVIPAAALADDTPTGPYPTVPRAYGVSPLFDARYVHDLYCISGLIADSANTPRFAFCAVHPNALSGYSIGHATYDRKHDTYIDNGPQESESDFGTFYVFDSLSGHGFPANGTYRWSSRDYQAFSAYPKDFHPAPLHYSMYTDPFQSGGIAVLPLPIAKRLTMYPDQFTIPRTFVGVVKDEARFWKQHRALYSVPRTAAQVQAVRDLLKSTNPLVALEATRLLLKAGQLQPAEAADLVGSGSDVRRALETAAILGSLPPAQQATIGQAVMNETKDARRPDDLRPVVVGAIVGEHIQFDAWYGGRNPAVQITFHRVRETCAQYAYSVARAACDQQKKLDARRRGDKYTAALMFNL